MAVVIETTVGDLTVDLFTKERPLACLNFIKLCKLRYYNFNLFHNIERDFIAQTGDPTGAGDGGQSVWGLVECPQKRFFEAESLPKILHTSAGLLSMVGANNKQIGSQFFFTLGGQLTSLDGEHCVIGEVVEGHDTLRKLNEAIVDEKLRPYQDIRITHTVVLDDPFPDPRGFQVPSRSPSPTAERMQNGRIAADEDIDDTQGKSMQEIHEMLAEREAKARATILEIVGDLPDAEMAPPENVLFVCKLNPVTNDDDLEIIFSRFGKVKNCEVIRDKKTGDSLQYAFVEFEEQKSCEAAYFKMDNVLIDDRRIHVDFSQSVAKVKWRGKGRGVDGANGRIDFNNLQVAHQSSTTQNGNQRKTAAVRRSGRSYSNSSTSRSGSSNSSAHERHKRKTNVSANERKSRGRSSSHCIDERKSRSTSRSTNDSGSTVRKYNHSRTPSVEARRQARVDRHREQNPKGNGRDSYSYSRTRSRSPAPRNMSRQYYHQPRYQNQQRFRQQDNRRNNARQLDRERLMDERRRAREERHKQKERHGSGRSPSPSLRHCDIRVERKRIMEIRRRAREERHRARDETERQHKGRSYSSRQRSQTRTRSRSPFKRKNDSRRSRSRSESPAFYKKEQPSFEERQRERDRYRQQERFISNRTRSRSVTPQTARSAYPQQRMQVSPAHMRNRIKSRSRSVSSSHAVRQRRAPVVLMKPSARSRSISNSSSAQRRATLQRKPITDRQDRSSRSHDSRHRISNSKSSSTNDLRSNQNSQYTRKNPFNVDRPALIPLHAQKPANSWQHKELDMTAQRNSSRSVSIEHQHQRPMQQQLSRSNPFAADKNVMPRRRSSRSSDSGSARILMQQKAVIEQSRRHQAASPEISMHRQMQEMRRRPSPFMDNSNAASTSSAAAAAARARMTKSSPPPPNIEKPSLKRKKEKKKKNAVSSNSETESDEDSSSSSSSSESEDNDSSSSLERRSKKKKSKKDKKAAKKKSKSKSKSKNKKKKSKKHKK